MTPSCTAVHFFLLTSRLGLIQGAGSLIEQLLFNPNWTGRGQSWPRWLWPQITGKLIKYFIFCFLTYSCRNVFRIFLNFWHDLKKWRLNVHFDVFSSEVLPRRSLPNPPLPPGFTVYTDHLRPGEVPPGGSSKKFQSVSGPGRVECGGGGFSVGRALSLFLSGQQAPHRSGHVPETAGLYSSVTHHTRDSLRRPGSFNLDLIGRPLLVSSEV